MLTDVRHAIRLLVRYPVFTATACLTIALAVGANAIVFSVADAALFRPLPYRDADRLVNVYRIGSGVDGTRIQGIGITGSLVDLLRTFAPVFEGVEVVRGARPTALATGADQNLMVGGFGPALPDLLGVRPQIGRSFTNEDVAAQDTIVLSDGFWRRAFNRDFGVLGKRLTFPDRSYVVIGVMPPTFRHFVGPKADAWLPIGDHDGSDLVARLRSRRTVAEAQRELDAAVARVPPRRTRLELQIVPAGWERSGAPPPGFVARAPRVVLFSLMGAVGFVLLIACTNVANLLLARAVGRQAEIAIRGALGATRGQLIRQFLIEALLLVGLGGVIATVVAWWGIHAIPAIMPADIIPSLLDVALPTFDLRVLAFSGLTVLVAALGSGIVPAIRASCSGAFDPLRAGGQRAAGSRGQGLVSRIFQALQTALTLVLLVGAGLFTNSLLRMVGMPAGYDSKHLAYATFGFPPTALLTQTERLAFANDLASRVSAIPGVRGVTLGEPPVSSLGRSGDRLEPDGDPLRALVLRTNCFHIRPDYFRVVGVPLTEGRPFGPEDQDNVPRVVVISENAARRLWPRRQSVVGAHVRFAGDDQPYTVVGVVPHLKTVDVANDSVEIFYPVAQDRYSPPGLLVRVAGDAASVAGSIRGLVRAIDPRVTVQRIGTVDRLFEESDPQGSSRFFAILFGALAGIGLLTASVGLFGVMSFAVSQRTHEIGVRLALGADRARVRQLLIRSAFGPVAAGVAAGSVAASWLSKFLASKLYHVSPRDPATFGAIIVLLLIVCGLTILVPIRRATRIDPVVALREE